MKKILHVFYEDAKYILTTPFPWELGCSASLALKSTYIYYLSYIVIASSLFCESTAQLFQASKLGSSIFKV